MGFSALTMLPKTAPLEMGRCKCAMVADQFPNPVTTHPHGEGPLLVMSTVNEVNSVPSTRNSLPPCQITINLLDFLVSGKDGDVVYTPYLSRRSSAAVGYDVSAVKGPLWRSSSRFRLIPSDCQMAAALYISRVHWALGIPCICS